MDVFKLQDNGLLLIQLQRGDERAFETLYNLYSKRIYRKIFSMVKVVDIADELTQMLFVKVWNKRQQINTDKNFEAYLYQIGQNLVYDFYRKIAREQELQDEVIAISTELYSHTEEDIFYKESKAIIDQAISNLPAQQQKVFTLCKIDGKTYEEVSELLHISKATVNNHITQATKTVRHFIFHSQKTAVTLFAAIFLHKL